ncbi:hypothetical protein V8C35DRAFT_315214 [Trichoderma chlorosporum]
MCLHQAPTRVFWPSARRTQNGLHSEVSCCICRPPFCSRGIRNPVGTSVSSSKQAVELHQDCHVSTDCTSTIAACKICWCAMYASPLPEFNDTGIFLNSGCTQMTVSASVLLSRQRGGNTAVQYSTRTADTGTSSSTRISTMELKTRCRSPCVAA